MELQDLVGLHKLTGIDFDVKSIEKYGELENCQCVNFVLDGKTYTATEDSNDGYRSTMAEIKISGFKVSNKFKAVKVLGMMRNQTWDRKCDIIDFADCVNGKIILSIGTDNTDDYYPSFVSDWSPDNLAVNAKADLTP